jgi:hypothetical protein
MIGIPSTRMIPTHRIEYLIAAIVGAVRSSTARCASQAPSPRSLAGETSLANAGRGGDA